MEITPQRPESSSSLSKKDSKTVVVVGVDASESSWDAFWWGCGEAQRTGGRVVAVYVSPIAGLASAMAAVAGVVDSSSAPFDWGERAATDLVASLGIRLSEIAADTGVDLEFVHAQGETAAELLRSAKAEGADLIVVGKSSKVHHLLAGSIGRRIIGKRNAPVVVVVP